MTERVAIASIRVEKRRREDLGDIAALARNIDRHGLIHPIVITDDNVLIAGERRLRAHEHLGHSHIDARRWMGLDENQRREIELAENLDRKDLTAIERSRKLVELAEVAADVDRSELRSEPDRKSSGRPIEAGSDRRVADRLGVPKTSIVEARQHVAAIEEYPELADEPQSVAIAAAKAVAALPHDERGDAIREIVNAPDVADVAFHLSDDAQKSELIRLRVRRMVAERLRPLSRVPAEFDAQDLAGIIDDEFFRMSIELPLANAQAWAEKVRAAMPSGLRIVQGGRR